MPSRAIPSLASIALLLACAPSVAAEELHVPGEYPTIQSAIVAAVQYEDVVVVAPGTYYERLDFLGKTIDVVSAEGALVTILDGAGSGPLVRMHDAFGGAGSLRGFTLRNARLEGPQALGAALQIENTDLGPRIEDNVFELNEAYGGAAIWCHSNDALIIDNIFRSNTATSRGAALWVQGGGPYIRGNVFEDNKGGPIYMQQCQSMWFLDNVVRRNRGSELGGALRLQSCSGGIVGNTIEGNEAIAGSGAIDSTGFFSSLVEDNLICGNRGAEGGAFRRVAGGSSFWTIRRNTIRGNSATLRGGGLYLTSDLHEQHVSQNVIYDNRAPEGEQVWIGVDWTGDLYFERNTVVQLDPQSSSTVHVTGTAGNVIVSSNLVVAAPGGVGLHCVATANPVQIAFDHNDVWAPGGVAYAGSCSDPTGMNGNLSVDPGLADLPGRDFHPLAGSPCVDAGDPQAFDPFGLDPDGIPWPLDGDWDGNLVVDIGAFELGHVALEVEGTPALGAPLTFRARGTAGLTTFILVGRNGYPEHVPPFGTLHLRLDRIVVAAVGTLPLTTTWTIPSTSPDHWIYTAQAIVRGPVPGTGNVSNSFTWSLD